MGMYVNSYLTGGLWQMLNEGNYVIVMRISKGGGGGLYACGQYIMYAICIVSHMGIHYHIVILTHTHRRTYMNALTHTPTHSRYIDIGKPFPISIVVISMC